RVTVHTMFYLPENADTVELTVYDYVIDAIDTVSAKIELAVRCDRLGVPLVSSMGAGNKLDPTAFEVSDLFKTSVDPLARVMRRELKARGVRKLRVVYSKEPPLTPEGESSGGTLDSARTGGSRRSTPGSCAFVPPVVGLILAGEVIKNL
ncbi:MAG: tRNA threonylcarbamoyladenosine dehydratase, partial [Eubacteriales bacterium]|nr:tRNA threonylcarbamoyladenosine dehydratase [Eubacteriales bacterium]